MSGLLKGCPPTPTTVLFLSTYADVDVSLTPAVRRRGAPALTLIHDFIMGWKCLKGGDANEEVLELQCLMFSRRVLWTSRLWRVAISPKIAPLCNDMSNRRNLLTQPGLRLISHRREHTGSGPWNFLECSWTFGRLLLIDMSINSTLASFGFITRGSIYTSSLLPGAANRSQRFLMFSSCQPWNMNWDTEYLLKWGL